MTENRYNDSRGKRMDIRRYLQNRGIKIADISKACGIPYATLHGGFDNPSSIKSDNLKKIADFLRISMDELYGMLRSVKSTILSILLDQKRSKLKGSIYHFTQIGFAYNTNRIEGGRLTEDETRYIFETNTLISGKQSNRVDDIVEMANHFYLFDIMLEEAESMLTELMIKKYHEILKNGTVDARKDWFKVGEYKSLPNEVGGKDTAKPENVSKEMKKLLTWYNALSEITIEEILEFHYRFELIHPFQDGNGRIGRIIMFKELLKNNIIPFIIEDESKAFYYRGLSEFESERGYLRDTCLSMQDLYKAIVDKYVGSLLSLME